MATTDIISSLFSIAPALDPRSAELQARQDALSLGGLFGAAGVNEYATPERQQAYMNKQAAQFALADMGVRKLGGLFGLQTPELKRASAIEGALAGLQDELSAEQMQDPTQLYPALIKRLQGAGMDKEALMVAAKAAPEIKDWQLNQAKIGTESASQTKSKAEALKALKTDDPVLAVWKEVAKKADPKSIQLSAANGYDISLLDIPKEDKQKLSSQAQMLIDAGYVYGSPEFNEEMKKFITSEITGKAKGTGNVTIGAIAPQIDLGKMGEEAGKGVGKRLVSIPDADKALSYVNEAIGMIDAGISTGSLANIKNTIAKVSSSFGVPIGDISRASNTEIYKAYLGNVVIPMMSQLGGSDSNEELKKMEGILASDVTLEEKSMRRILRQAQEAIKRDVEWTRKQATAASEGKPAPTQLTPPSSGQRKVWNPKTQKLEVIGGK